MQHPLDQRRQYKKDGRHNESHSGLAIRANTTFPASESMDCQNDKGCDAGQDKTPKQPILDFWQMPNRLNHRRRPKSNPAQGVQCVFVIENTHC